MQVDNENPFLPYRSGYLNFALEKCQSAKQNFYQAISMQPENFAFLTGFVRAVAQCGGSEEEKVQAVNAARNMYRVKPFLPVIESLAAIEARIKKRVRREWVERLKANFGLIKKRKQPDVSPAAFEEDLSPPRLSSVF